MSDQTPHSSLAAARVTIISGTNHTDANTLLVAQHYQQKMQALGVQPKLYSLTELAPDFMATDMYGLRSAAFAPIEQLMRESDVFVFVVPEYNGSYPGVLKLFVDSMKPSLVFHGKRAALVGVSTGRFGNVRGLDHFAGVMNYVQVNVLPYRAHLMHIDRRMTGGHITHPDTLTEVDRQLAKLLPFISLVGGK